MTVTIDRDFRFADVLRPGDVVAWPQAVGEPLGLTERLVAERDVLPAAGIFIGMCTSRTLSPACAGRWAITALNGAGTNRTLAAADLLDIIPAPLSSVPALLQARAIPVDVVLLRVRPHDTAGFVTTGVIADYTMSLVMAARCIIAEVDERLPMTGGDALLPTAAIDRFVPRSGGEVLMPDAVPTAIDAAVASRVADFIPDRATLQLGIGGLPTAIGHALMQHSGLGIHTGVISDVLVDLVQAGAVTNAHKGIDGGISITGGLFGTQRLSAFADRNPDVELRCVDYTHDRATMAKIRMLHCVNGAIEIDLSGQVNAEQAGSRYLGAVGGQLDFVRGAMASPGGRSIIALPSTTVDGKRSRIVSSLDGRPVTTPRSDADIVVTEFGIAELRGCNLGERARRLTAIAHPAFQDVLRHASASGPGVRRQAKFAA